MKPAYIIKENEIYEVISEDKAAKVNVKNGVASIDDKTTVDYDKNVDFLYAFFEIKAKFADLFKVNEETEDDNEKPIINKSKVDKKSKNED